MSMITLFCHQVVPVVKARAWLTSHEVPFNQHKIMTSPLTADELQQILTLTENGTDDLISDAI